MLAPQKVCGNAALAGRLQKLSGDACAWRCRKTLAPKSAREPHQARTADAPDVGLWAAPGLEPSPGAPRIRDASGQRLTLTMRASVVRQAPFPSLKGNVALRPHGHPTGIRARMCAPKVLASQAAPGRPKSTSMPSDIAGTRFFGMLSVHAPEHVPHAAPFRKGGVAK